MSNNDRAKATLSVSCVYYDTACDIFEETLESLSIAISHAKDRQSIDRAEVHLINNNPEKEIFFRSCIAKYSKRLGESTIHSGHGNLGYGKGNNLAISQTACKYHLIINPDIIVDEKAIEVGIEYLEKNQDVALVAPDATNQNGEVEYLAKRMPSFLIIFLRGINNNYLNKIFRKKLYNYNYKDKIPSTVPVEIELASGCFMLCKSDFLKKAGGFSEQYFLYFEDFDLSKKINYWGKIVYLPSMKVCHLGGYAAKKGLLHTKLFLSSFFVFKRSLKKNVDPNFRLM